MSRPLLLVLLGAVVLTGCARTSTETTVNPDGSWTRKVKLVVSDQGGQSPDSPTSAKIEDVFRPPAGPDWKIERTQEKDEIILTAIRNLKAGESITNDIVIKKDKSGTPMLLNQVSVTVLPDGKIEYREMILWKDKRVDLMEGEADKVVADVRKLLPAGIATQENARAVADRVARELWKALFGPGDPMVATLLTHEELAERKLKQRVAAKMDSALTELFSQQMSEAERRKFLQDLFKLESFSSKSVFDTDEESKKAEESGEGSPKLVAMFTSVKLPGKIISTNGDVDLSTGEVFWGFYSEAATLEDLTFSAICDPKG